MGNHAHDGQDFTRAFAVGIALNLGFVLFEAAFGIAANSMALLSDAGHNLSDVLGLVLAWGGAAMAKRAASARFTYGLKKAPILAALFNSLFLLVAVGAILAEAVRRLIHPAATEAKIVIAVAATGIVINGITAWLFARGRRNDINIRGAFLHMAADAVVSLAVVIGGFVILWTGLRWVDPLISIAVAVVILWSSVGLLRESIGMSLMGVPSGIDLAELETTLVSVPGISGVHDLHVWPLSTTETALTAHLVYPDGPVDTVIEQVRVLLHDRFAIEHCTLQVERAAPLDHGCR